jgi:GST-like protein
VAANRKREYVLYGSRNSGSAAVECALEIAKAPYRIVDAATWRRKDDASSFARLQKANPLHQVPTLLCPDGTALTESAAILIHLALMHPRARLLRALVFIAANCYSNIGVLDYPERWLGKSDKAANDKLRKGAKRRLHRMWSVFADNVAPKKPPRFLFSAQQPGAADILAAVVSRWSGARKHLARHHPALHEVMQRVEAHAMLAPVFERHWGAGPVVTS